MIVRMTDPLETLMSLQRAMDATRSSDWFGTTTTGRGSFPPINVFRKGEDFVVVAEMPGVARADMDVEVKKNQVRLRGKKSIAYDENTSVHRRERVAGEFDRTITMAADIDAKAAIAEYRDGLLAIHLPRAEKDKPRTITIE